MESVTKSGLTVEEFTRSNLYGMPLTARGEVAALPPELVADTIRSAEDSLEKDLGTFFGLKRVASNPRARKLDKSTYDVAQPAYNYPADLWTNERWGQIRLDFAPVSEVTQFFFAFPGNYREIYNAKEWVQLDDRFGYLNIVPTGGAAVLASFNAWVMSVLVGARSLPHSLFIDYTAGLTKESLRREHNDLLEIVRLRALMSMIGVLGVIRAQGAGSCSTSLDGLSQSESFAQGQYGPYSGAYMVAKEREQQLYRIFKDTQVGVPFVVL